MHPRTFNKTHRHRHADTHTHTHTHTHPYRGSFQSRRSNPNPFWLRLKSFDRHIRKGLSYGERTLCLYLPTSVIFCSSCYLIRFLSCERFLGKRALFCLRALNQTTGRLLRKGIEAPLENTLANAVNVLNRASAFLDETGQAAQRAHIPATKAQFPATRAHIEKC